MSQKHAKPLQSSVFSEEDMVQICCYLRQLTDTLQVCLYKGDGRSDGTVIIICDDDKVRKYFAELAIQLSQRPEYMGMTTAEARFAAFEELYSEFAVWRNSVGIYTNPDVFFDVFIFPLDWKQRTGELSIDYRHPVPFYLKRLTEASPIFVV